MKDEIKKYFPNYGGTSVYWGLWALTIILPVLTFCIMYEQTPETMMYKYFIVSLVHLKAMVLGAGCCYFVLGLFWKKAIPFLLIIPLLMSVLFGIISYYDGMFIGYIFSWLSGVYVNLILTTFQQTIDAAIK